MNAGRFAARLYLRGRAPNGQFRNFSFISARSFSRITRTL